jgi:hypothetical protein
MVSLRCRDAAIEEDFQGSFISAPAYPSETVRSSKSSCSVAGMADAPIGGCVRPHVRLEWRRVPDPLRCVLSACEVLFGGSLGRQVYNLAMALLREGTWPDPSRFTFGRSASPIDRGSGCGSSRSVAGNQERRQTLGATFTYQALPSRMRRRGSLQTLLLRSFQRSEERYSDSENQASLPTGRAPISN